MWKQKQRFPLICLTLLYVSQAPEFSFEKLSCF